MERFVRCAAQMPSAAAAPLRSTDLDCQIVVIQSPETASLQKMMGCSRWNVTSLPDPDAIATQLASGAYPAVICGTQEWRKVVEAARKSTRPPGGVIVVAGDVNDLEWLDVLESGAHYLPLDKLNAAHLFSLLNHSWRSWHRD
jgi:hypothetical protein